MAALLQLGAQVREVLDDAVVDDRDRAGAVDVRVRVAVVGRAVGGPAGVADAGGGGRQRAVGQRALEVGQLAGALRRRQLAVGQQGDARGVVAAVLQPPQALDDHVEGRLVADVTHDAAHGCQGIHAVSAPSVASVDRPSAVRRSRPGAWSALRAAPAAADDDDLGRLRGLGEPIDLDEVEEVYLPLSRLLNLHVGAAQQRHLATATFLGARPPRPPLRRSSSASRAASRSARAPRRACCGRCSRAGRTTRASTWSPPTASCCPTPSWTARPAGAQGLPRVLRPAGAAPLPRRRQGRRGEVTAPVYSHLSTTSCPASASGPPPRHPDRRGPQRAAAGAPGPTAAPALRCRTSSTSRSTSTPPSGRRSSGTSTASCALRETAFADPASYFHRFAALTDDEAARRAEPSGARSTSPTCAEHPADPRPRHPRAAKGADHAVQRVRLRKL